MFHAVSGVARHTRGRALAAVAATGAVALLAACSTPGSNRAAESSAPAEVSTEVGTEPVTIVLYDGAGLEGIDNELIAAFNEEYPNITVETRFDPDNVQAQNAPRVLASDNPPDLARIVALGDIVGNNLLTPLTPWSEAYGWDLPGGQLAMYTVDDTDIRGSGTQYTVASGFVTTGIYYNKTIAEEIGMTEPPATVAELETAMADAKAAGITPMIIGNSTGQGVFPTQMMINNFMGAQAVNEWVFNAADATIDTPESAEAVRTVAGWIDAGYFNDDANGTDSAGAAGRFAEGEALFFPSGNWDANTLSTSMGDNVGFFAPPALEAGQLLAMSDPVTNFGIPARAAHKDEAAAFLNFLMSDAAREILVSNGFAPSGSGDAPPTTGSLNEAIQSSFAALVEADGQVQFVQNATNGSNAAWTEQSQLLFGGRATAEDYVAAIQANYVEELGR